MPAGVKGRNKYWETDETIDFMSIQSFKRVRSVVRFYNSLYVTYLHTGTETGRIFHEHLDEWSLKRFVRGFQDVTLFENNRFYE